MHVQENSSDYHNVILHDLFKDWNFTKMNQLYTYYLLLWCKYDMILKAGKFLRNNFFTLELPDSKNCISWTTCVCLINKIGTVLTKKIPPIKNIQISPPSFWHLTQERFFLYTKCLITQQILKNCMCSDENASKDMPKGKSSKLLHKKIWSTYV